jgi:hypothetical protein
MSYSVNRPMALAAAPVAAKLSITVVPSGPAAALADPAAVLTVNDAADLASASAANVVWSAPLTALFAGMNVDLGVTATGLTVSAVPPGVAANLEFA